MEQALELRRRLFAQADDPYAANLPKAVSAAGELTLAFTRAARAVRQTIALKNHIDAERQALIEDDEAAEAEAEAEAADRRATATLRGFMIKEQVQEIVTEAIEAQAEPEDSDDGDDSERERLLDALHERLEDMDDLAIGDRSVGEIVASVCQEIELTPDWSLWEAEDWAIEEAEAKTPGSPYAGPGAVRRRLTAPWERPYKEPLPPAGGPGP